MLTPPQNLPPIKRMKALTAWLNELRDFCAALAPMNSHNINVQHTAIGTSYIGNPPPTPARGGGIRYRGDWSGDSSYSVDDLVTIRGGIAAGTYLCVVAAPVGTPAPNDPSLGIYWVSLARGNTLGQWG